MSWLSSFRRLRQEHLLFEYFTLVFGEWQTTLGGTALLIILWSVWFYTGNPPAFVNWIVLAGVLFAAGYKVWRADHIRLIPQLDIVATRLEDMPIPVDEYLTDTRTFCQLVPKCLTESPLYECRGHLRQVRRWSVDRWIVTGLGPLTLKWGNTNDNEITLHPDSENVLNVCYIGHAAQQVVPYVDADLTWQAIFSAFPRQPGGDEAYQFDVSITCSHRSNGQMQSVKPVNVCLELRIVDVLDLSHPQLEIITEGNLTSEG
jgi:hypothetical protein